MGCYAAIHALKMADAFCKADKKANVLIVCTELCTLHFQKEHTIDNMTSSMLFSDGAAAVLVTGNEEQDGLTIDHFYSTVACERKKRYGLGTFIQRFFNDIKRLYCRTDRRRF